MLAEKERTYEDLLAELALADERVVVMTAENRAAIRNLPSLLGPRFIDTGITEQTMIGAAAGLALRGRIPVVHALATFLTMRAFEFVRTGVGIPHLPVKLVGGVPGFLSDGNGPTHQALEDVALMRTVPGMHVFCPADLQDMLLGLETVLTSPHPTYIRYNDRPAPMDHHPIFRFGQAETVAKGSDATILVYGFLFCQALEARAILEEQGLSVGVVNVRMPKPLDEAAVLHAARRSRLLVTVEDHFQTGGLYSAVAECLVRERESVDVLPLALDERWFRPALLDDVLVYEGFTGPQIAARITARLAHPKRL